MADKAPEKKPIPLEQLPAECDALHKKHFDMPFDAVVSALVGLMKVLALRVIERVSEKAKQFSDLEKRVSELEGFRDVVVQAHEAMQKAEEEKVAAAEKTDIATAVAKRSRAVRKNGTTADAAAAAPVLAPVKEDSTNDEPPAAS